MVRSALQDVHDKFRFKVTFLDLQVNGFFSVNTNSSFGESISGGFSEVTLPRVSVNTRTYRENIDTLRRIKAPGIASYEPITLRRGKVTNNRDLYKWFTLVNNDVANLSSKNEISGLQNYIPALPTEYRREVIIQLIDREGITRKAWFVFNSFPKEYKGGNDFNSSSEEKLIEELVLEYEAFVELEDETIDKLNEESTQWTNTTSLSEVFASLLG